MLGVLSAYAAIDPDIGYCQGMNFLVGLLLAFLPRAADAFGALVLLMHERRLRDLYKPDMSLLQVGGRLILAVAGGNVLRRNSVADANDYIKYGE